MDKRAEPKEAKKIMQNKPFLRRTFLSTFVFWAVAVTLDAVCCATYELSHPIPDLYANHISFQLMVFAIFQLPFWIIGLLIVLAIRSRN